MRLERRNTDGHLLCSVDSGGTVSNGGQDCDLTMADLRWLVLVGGPAILAQERIGIRIEGQTTLDEAIASTDG